MNRETISISHVSLTTDVDFGTVRSRLEGAVPPLDPEIIPLLIRGDVDAAAERRRTGPSLYIFGVTDHGALLAGEARRTNALQYAVGNPLTAIRMTRHDVRAALYAPLRVLLYETAGGGTASDYDLPSTVFGQFRNDKVTAIARELDEQLLAALSAAMAAGPEHQA